MHDTVIMCMSMYSTGGGGAEVERAESVSACLNV